MNRDDIIKMAHEASPDMTWYAGLDDPTNVSIEELEFLERFAALVAAAERERIIADNAPEIEKINAHIRKLEDAVKAEREACAKVIDAKIEEVRLFTNELHLLQCAAAIRARGQE